MDLKITPESTPTRYVPDPSEPISTLGDVERYFPLPDEFLGEGETLDIPVPEYPPEHLLLNVVLTFDDDMPHLVAPEIGIVAGGGGIQEAFRHLIEATRKQLEHYDDERAELRHFLPITWFRFVPPDKAHRKTLTERFNEAYDEEAKQEDEEFVRNLKRYHRRRFSDEW